MDNVLCNNIMRQYIKAVDLIVFDIDGVLIDTSESFIATIVTTTKYYINEMLNLPVDPGNISKNDVMKFKEHSGFNNDWDLTTAMISYHLYMHKNSADGITLDRFLDMVDEYGGSLDGLRKVIAENAAPELAAWITTHVDEEKIRRTFQEFYAGTKYCEQLYGFVPEIHDGAGSIEKERILLDTTLLRKWRRKTGILTGRMKNETEAALSMLKLENIDRDLVEYCDYILPDKPHPAKIERILDRADSRNALYIGDSIDDYLTVVNYNKIGKSRNLQFGLVAGRIDSFPAPAGQFRADSVNGLLEYVLKYCGRK